MHEELKPLLTDCAKRADFRLLMTFYLEYYIDGPESVRHSGDGVDDIDHFIRLYDASVKTTFQLDLGALVEGYRLVDRDDLVFLRAEYVRLWGETDNPNVYLDPVPYSAAG